MNTITTLENTLRNLALDRAKRESDIYLHTLRHLLLAAADPGTAALELVVRKADIGILAEQHDATIKLSIKRLHESSHLFHSSSLLEALREAYQMRRFKVYYREIEHRLLEAADISEALGKIENEETNRIASTLKEVPL